MWWEGPLSHEGDIHPSVSNTIDPSPPSQDGTYIRVLHHVGATMQASIARSRCLSSTSTPAPPVRRASAKGGSNEEKWTKRTLEAAGNAPPAPALRNTREAARAALASPNPPDANTRESYRFTDLRTLLETDLCRSDPSIGTWEVFDLPKGAYVGPLEGAPEPALKALDEQTKTRGTFFATLNGACASDAVVVYLPIDKSASHPVRLRRSAVPCVEPGATGVSATAPRTLVVVDEGANVELWEEYEGDVGQECFTNAVTEVVVAKNAKVVHRVIQLSGEGAFHTQQTLVRQAQNSKYELTDICVGSKLARHDVNVAQEGSDTETKMKHFVLCGKDQLHDVHTTVRLEHPRGACQQLHKCIVAHNTGRGVFDGNVRVERNAQQTDAGQLTRNLLLAKNATVNIRPNLQIVADDVKCTHGATVSDLEQEELFYFQSRGIDPITAREMLVYSFGSEVVQELGNKELIAKVERAVRLALADTLQ